MSTGLAQTLERAVEIREEHIEAFNNLARRAGYHGDEGITPEEVERVCTAAGKSIGNFHGLVRECRQRQRLREDYSRLQIVEQQMRDAQQRKMDANDELQAAKVKYHTIVPEIDADINRLVNEYSKLSTVPTQLQRTCPDTVLREHMKWALRSNDIAAQEAVRKQMIEF